MGGSGVRVPPRPSQPKVIDADVERRPVAEHSSPRETGLSGPSFLGLGTPDEDEEFSRPYGDDLYRTNWGARFLFALIVIGVAGGLAYTQWRANHPLQAAPPAAPAAQATTGGNNVASDATGTSSSSTSDPQNAANRQVSSSSQNSTSQSAATKSGDDAAAKPDSQSAGDKSGAKSSDGSKNDESAQAGSHSRSDDEGGTKADDAAADSDSKSAGAAPAVVDNSDEPVRQAEVYLSGKSVPQNCDEGVGILRAAATRGNTRSLIKLGALYATGNCVPMDRLIAYHYFSRAHLADPNNEWVEENRGMLWANMTDEERTRAKLDDGEIAK
jgi:hypothetical protein